MKGGFSFCGVDIADLGLEYAPPLDQTNVFSGSNYKIHQEVFDGHHGGYYYGTTVQPKDFILKCFFENSHINRGVLSNIESVFSRGRTGKLVFQNRDWLWYSATVVDVNTSSLLNYMNGFILITLRAFYPFGRHDYISLQSLNSYDKYLVENSGLMSEAYTPTVEFRNQSSSQSLLLYNGGTEVSHVSIEIQGTATKGIKIKNITNGSFCSFKNFTSSDTTAVSKKVICDGLNGKTIITDGVASQLKFLYHDGGFLSLEPSFPIHRNVTCLSEANSNKIKIFGVTMFENLIGKFILIDKAWAKILEISGPSEVTIDKTASKTNSFLSQIVSMNEIQIELSEGSSIDYLKFNYKPTFK